MNGDSAVSIRGLTKSFGSTQALSDVSFSFAQGESRALIGKNGAGKSTVVSILTGLEKADAGTIEVMGKSGDQSRLDLGCVFQRSTLIPAATVAENIAFGSFPKSRGLISWSEVRQSAAALLDEWGCSHLLNLPVEEIEPLERKIVEICRVLARGPKVLILDEPTAGLDIGSTRRLFAHIAHARSRGVSVLYISHHLQEIFEVCDSVTILRDGRLVNSSQLKDLTISDLVSGMLGDVPQSLTQAEARAIADREDVVHRNVILEIEDLSFGGELDSVALKVHQGECVGITGLDGSGFMRVAEMMTGQAKPDSGSVLLRGEPIPYGSVSGCIDRGIGFTPEDRHLSGYVPAMSVAENSTLSIMDRFVGKSHFIRSKVRDATYNALANDWGIKAWGPGQPTEELSGGNQQKVVLARSVAADPQILVLMNPTAGVDVGAKESIYETILELKSKGKGIVLVTSDDSDLEICDRVLVMFQGVIRQELQPPYSESTIARAVQGDE